MNRHNASATGLAALGAALDAKMSGTPLDPALAARVDELLAALGAGNALEDVNGQEVRPLLAELRFMHANDAKLLYQQTRALGWSHTDPEVLQAGGDVSVGFAHALTRMIVPGLEGLSARLGAPGAAFLDIGVGVAALAIAMAGMWPELRVVGIDPWQPSLTIARNNVAQAGLGDRITLREQRAEDLEDESAFDLTWVPSTFMREAVIAPACERAHRALRPGGWLLFPMVNPGNDAQAAALGRLRTTLFGGYVTTPPHVEGLLRDTGFVDVRTLPAPPGAVVAMVAGRRKLA
jgi:SAM-dependent methyltransferase